MDQTEKDKEMTDANVAPKQETAILEIGGQLNELTVLAVDRIVALEAHQHVTQDLLKTILVSQGISREAIALEIVKNHRIYEKQIAVEYQIKLKSYQDKFAESANSPGKTAQTLLNQFARKLLIAAEHHPDGYAFIKQIAAEINDSQLTEAVDEILGNQSNHGLFYNEAFAGRPDVFSADFIAAITAADTDGDLVKHLRIFLRYDE